MSEILKELEQSLNTGFINSFNHSKLEYRPHLLQNDATAGKKVLTTLNRSLLDCDEFWFSVAFITSSGVATLLTALQELELKGIKGKVLASQYLNFTDPEALRKLLLFKNISLRISVGDNFHSKGYLFRKADLYELVVGSSNLTASALCTNKELNLKVTASNESQIIQEALTLFNSEFQSAQEVNSNFIAEYKGIHEQRAQYRILDNAEHGTQLPKAFKPNKMQLAALTNLELVREEGNNRALLVSATGTGKTYLSAFDAQRFNPRRFLFVVHRRNIAEAAMSTFKSVFGQSRSMGMYSGAQKDIDNGFIFSTIQTLSKPENLETFSPDHFDYIVIDETHRAGAESYTRIIDHFKPKFLLGMSATPERTDGFDIFGLFNHTIAYEIRLHQALEEKMLCPFHYYGITDISIDGKLLEEDTTVNSLTSQERIDRVIEKTQFYGSDGGIVRGLIFCSRIEECEELSIGLNKAGLRTIALSGKNSESERDGAINCLETDDHSVRLDYILSVDVFNEGIDIPSVNQIVMLRPTQSTVVFVQQLGRGLRLSSTKKFLTVIDFIGNYKNSYLVPIALYGDTSYNKDSLRKLIASGSSFVPGKSTINFDRITREKIFSSIDNANMSLLRDLRKDYDLLKFKLGKIPTMMDFIEHGSRDPQLFVASKKSYFNFVASQENSLTSELDTYACKLLELFSSEINNSKRVEESIIVKEILGNGRTSLPEIRHIVSITYGYIPNDATLISSIRNLNFEFVTEKFEKKQITVRKIHNTDIVKIENNTIIPSESFSRILKNKFFLDFLLDSAQYSIHAFDTLFSEDKWINGFVLYRKYSRKDVFRILNWDKNPVAQNVGGYILSQDKKNCALFVNYEKEDDISATTKYEDKFLNNSELAWMSKSKRTLESPDVQAIMNYKSGLRLPLFIKKSNVEGNEFYYMGDVTPKQDGFEQSSMPGDNGKTVNVVKVIFSMDTPVEETMFEYIVAS